MGDLLNSFVHQHIVVKIFIVTEADPPSRYNDGTDRPDRLVKTTMDKIHFRFMHEEQ
ncbi:hypothetical protein BDZ89DRAFT_1060631 [Hymenopellis radicata]|nr:hypothetical protein BDZ89DRAFT_1060631 [Hymenopellis radicata]